MLQTDEIPREPTKDNMIPPLSDAENRWGEGAFRFLPCLNTTTDTHTTAGAHLCKDTLVAHTCLSGEYMAL